MVSITVPSFVGLIPEVTESLSAEKTGRGLRRVRPVGEGPLIRGGEFEGGKEASTMLLDKFLVHKEASTMLLDKFSVQLSVRSLVDFCVDSLLENVRSVLSV